MSRYSNNYPTIHLCMVENEQTWRMRDRQQAADQNTQVGWVREKAAAGDADCQCQLAFRYLEGLGGLKQDKQAAVAWYTKAAEQGHAAAQFNLGVLYEQGQGVKQDYRMAARWYQQAAQQGYASAQANLAYLYRHGLGVACDRQQELEWNRKAAAQGELHALCSLAVSYHNGSCGQQDACKALELYRRVLNDPQKTADRQRLDACAQYGLGLMHYEGQAGLARDESEAYRLFHLASDKGDVDATYMLGVMLQNGQGVKKDAKLARFYYSAAAFKGHAAAQCAMGDIYASGLRHDYEKALEYYTKAAQQGDAGALRGLGTLYLYGRGTAKDAAKAVQLLTQSAQQGDADAQYQLGLCYQRGMGVARDEHQALLWYQKAAAQGHAAAARFARLMG